MRLRVKGKFVTKNQAYDMLGNIVGSGFEKLSTDELKGLL